MKNSTGHLKKADKILAKYIQRIGPCALKFKRHKNLYQPLMESVVYQQLAGKAAAAILARFKALYPGTKFPTTEAVLGTSLERLRSAGLSRAKSLAILDIAQKTVDGVVPHPKELKKLSDDEIIERLTQIHGVGPWTVHMLLIKMGRLDVLPITDYGIRKAYSLIYRKKKLPTPKELLNHGEKWRPYRSVASWYLWRSLDQKII